jgi:hypothetical protein
MSIDATWNLQAITPLDASAMAASERISSGNSDNDRRPGVVQDDFLGGRQVPYLDDKELFANVSVTDGPGMPLIPSGKLSDNDSGLIRPVASNGEGSAADMLRENVVLAQVDRSYAANLNAHQYAEQATGHIVNYTA